MTATRRLGLWTVLCGALAIAAGVFFGESYIPRLPHHAGYFLVSVPDEVRAPAPPRPRHTVVVVVDGLRRAAAETMRSVAVLRAAGQCRSMNMGKLTVSRPVYAILSTGLEADRTGSRNNDEKTPLAAESIWEVARRSGLEVAGASHLPWWKQLFPDGFSRYHRTEPEGEDIFAPETLTDLNLFHPDYVDEAGHSFGAASPVYDAAVARVDVEIQGLLARIDLDRDVVVLTSDHGHVDRGGHGAEQPEVANVLTCFAGKGIVRSARVDVLDARTFAPALAVRLGLPFPRHMRAGIAPGGAPEDDLDAIAGIVDLAGFPAYAADRGAAIARFREANRRALEDWLGGAPGTWARLYAREGSRRTTRLAIGAALVLAVFVAWRARTGRLRTVPAALAFVVVLHGGATLLHVLTRGSFDFTAVTSRASYVPACFVAGFVATAVAWALHLALVRDLPRLARDQTAGLGLLLAANALHPFAYGWPLGFPLPGAHALVFPFFAAILLVAGGLATAALGGFLALRTSS
ncbi:MAG: type phosphodiesterase/nucleotide pyrophosphatase [Labilithrix sp.]|nr:type phosphodiesterase/nucleotide pyrophosphatase [Labilithrix sp.]